MKTIVISAALSLTLLIASCGGYAWPPHEKKIRSMFDESKQVLTEIEAEMIADGLSLIGPGPQRRRHGEPVLTAAQRDKYDKLFERLPYHWNLARREGVTLIEVYGPNPPLMGKDFYYSLAHRDVPAELPSCDAGGWTVSCGTCSVPLGDNWSIEYFWSPNDIGPDWDGSVGEGLPTEEEIQAQYEQELNECLIAGMKKMGAAVPVYDPTPIAEEIVGAAQQLFDCRFSRPRQSTLLAGIDESTQREQKAQNQFVVTADGEDCDEAIGFLNSQGAVRDISFFRTELVPSAPPIEQKRSNQDLIHEINPKPTN